MINESILGRRFRFGRSCGGHRISPLAPQYQCPRQALLIITTGQAKAATTRVGVIPWPAPVIVFRHSMLYQVCHKYRGSREEAPSDCLEHSDLLEVP